MQYEGWDMPIRANAYYSDSGWTTWGEFFGGCPRYKTVKQWVELAEELARQNNNLLPRSRHLTTNGYSGLCNAIRNHPEKFSHIPQDKPRNTTQEWVVIAESIASQHGGTLPNKGWLTQNRHYGLLQAMSKDPKSFRHLPQNRNKNSIKDWVQIAGRLASEHGDILPCRSWLRKNGYSGLDKRMEQNPTLFLHIKQDRPYSHHKTLEEWVEIAEDLTQTHNGRLPNARWLRDHGYSGLDTAIKQHRELFAHIPKLKLNTNGQPITENLDER